VQRCFNLGDSLLLVTDRAAALSTAVEPLLSSAACSLPQCVTQAPFADSAKFSAGEVVRCSLLAIGRCTDPAGDSLAIAIAVVATDTHPALLVPLLPRGFAPEPLLPTTPEPGPFEAGNWASLPLATPLPARFEPSPDEDLPLYSPDLLTHLTPNAAAGFRLQPLILLAAPSPQTLSPTLLLETAPNGKLRQQHPAGPLVYAADLISLAVGPLRVFEPLGAGLRRVGEPFRRVQQFTVTELRRAFISRRRPAPPVRHLRLLAAVESHPLSLPLTLSRAVPEGAEPSGVGAQAVALGTAAAVRHVRDGCEAAAAQGSPFVASCAEAMLVWLAGLQKLYHVGDEDE
jgi:hypothetical protein